MKTLITLAILFFASISYSQTFSLRSDFSQGIKFDKSGNFTQYQSAIDIIGQYNYKNLIAGFVSKSVFADSVPAIYAGVRMGWQLWSKADQNISVHAEYLQGTEGRMIPGGGVAFDYGGVTFTGNVGYELKHEDTYLDFSIGIPIIE